MIRTVRLEALLQILLLEAQFLPFGVLAQDPDWAEIHYGVRRILRDYYGSNGPRKVRGMQPVEGCLADGGDVCFGGDHEDQLCGLVPICRTEDEIAGLLRDLRSEAESKPGSAYAIGQAVYAFARLGRLIEAFQLAEACQAEDWWCAFLQGSVLQRAGQSQRAEARFRDALGTADPLLACRVTDVAILLGGRDRRRYEEESCETREGLKTRFWWLSDPFFSIPGNDRWAEHMRRRFELILHEQLLAATGNAHPDSHETWVVRRGWEDSWLRGPRDRFVSHKAARYRFVPEVGVFSETVRDLAFSLEAEKTDEGFTPTYGPIVSLPVQVARFRQADSLVLAVAVSLQESELSGSEGNVGHLVLSDAPGSFLLDLTSSFHQERAAFLAQTPAQPYVVSLEVSGEWGMGRHRLGVDPLETQAPGLSDLLLYRPTGRDEPNTRRMAAGMMLGGAVVSAEDPLGVYWETYGTTSGGQLRIEVEVRRERRGLMDAVRRLLPGGGSGGTGRLGWNEIPPEPQSGNTVTLDVSSLEPGRYVLLVRVGWRGQEPVEAERAFQIR